MNHELTPKPEKVYEEYIRAEERLSMMRQAQRELPNLALEDVQKMTAERSKAVDREAQRLDEVVKRAGEYAVSNLPDLKEQAVQDARYFGKRAHPI